MKTAILILMLAASVAAGGEWTVYDLFNRDPAIGHRDMRVSYVCKTCDFRQTFDWEDVMWYEKAEKALLAHVVIHQLQPSPETNRVFLVSAITNATIDKPATIREWAADGSICAVLGHQWGALQISLFGDILPNARKCGVCGKIEKKQEVGK